MNYDKTVKDIEQYTGLDYHYILKCVRELPDVFNSSLVDRGDNNSLKFNSNALSIFDQIKQMKDSNKSLRTIRLFFEDTFNQNQNKSIKTDSEGSEISLTKILLERLNDSNKEALNAFKDAIKSKDEHIKSLEKNILLITDGKDPSLIRNDLENQKSKIANLENIIKTNESVISEMRSQIVNYENSLKDLKDQIITLSKHYDEVDKQKNLLVSELYKLEGSIFVGKKRKDILDKLISSSYKLLTPETLKL